MGATKETLITVDKVVDHDCGNYRIGEIDFGIRSAMLEDYLKHYGLEGRNELLLTLSYLMSEVHRVYQETSRPQRAVTPAEKQGG